MPKSKEYISSESDTDSSDIEPKPKKKTPEHKEEKKATIAESPKKKASGGAQKGPGGELKFQLSKMRYVTVSEFRGKVMVGIREFYEKDGELLPGRKGIALSTDQWNSLKDQIEEIDSAVKDLS